MTRLTIRQILPSQVAATIVHTIALVSLFVSLLLRSPTVAAAFSGITNPSIDPKFGANQATASTGSAFVTYFIHIWNAAMVVGGIIVLFFFIQASIEWITAGGDSAKIQKARDRLIQSTLGLFILIFSFVIINFISYLLFGVVGFDILNPKLPAAVPLG